MSRQIGLSRVYASVSVTAVLGLLVGCSQPASYATVDLGGSYGNGTPQTYSAPSGLPVYQSTQVYTTPGNAPPVSQSQLVYLDAPSNQVASLSPSYIGGYSQPAQSYPVFNSVDQGPVLTDETILRSDGYIDTGRYGGVETATLAPGGGSIGYDRMPVLNDVPQYLPAPQPAAPLPYSAPMIAEALPLPAPVPAPMAMIEAMPLPAPLPLPAPMAEPIQTVGDDYASLSAVPFDAVPYQAVGDLAAAAPTPLDMMQAAPQDFAGLPTQPPRNDVQGVVDYYDLNQGQQQQNVVQNVRLPGAAQIPTQTAPTAAYSDTAPNGQGIALPPASQAYPRPYEALPPGFFPSYEFPSGNDLISQAPAPQEPVQVAALAPQMPLSDIFVTGSAADITAIPVVQQATGGQSYTIQPGDTLYGIARKHGVTPLEIARSNGLPLAGTIYPGTVLSIPAGGISGRPETLGDAPVVVLQSAQLAPVETFAPDAASISTYTADLTDQSVDMIDVKELARMFRERESGQPGAMMPVISAAAGSAMRGRPDLTPTEVISQPGGAVASPAFTQLEQIATPTPVAFKQAAYTWPVHGEVYRLQGGGIEIAAPAGQTVAAAAGGRVVHVENGSRGVMVVIEHDDGWRSITLGLASPGVLVGQRVFSGDPLGQTGAQRISFELRDDASNVAEVLGVLRS